MSILFGPYHIACEAVFHVACGRQLSSAEFDEAACDACGCALTQATVTLDRPDGLTLASAIEAQEDRLLASSEQRKREYHETSCDYDPVDEGFPSQTFRVMAPDRDDCDGIVHHYRAAMLTNWPHGRIRPQLHRWNEGKPGR